MRRSFSLIALLISLAAAAFAQKAKPSPTPDPYGGVILGDSDVPANPKGGTKLLKLTTPSLKDEVATSEVEPRLKLFRMNVRFLRANYSIPIPVQSPKSHQYSWNYYPDAALNVEFFQYPAGSFSGSVEELRRQAATKFESTMLKGNGQSISSQSAKDVIVDNVPATEYELVSNGKKIYARTFIDNDVWYILLAQPKTAEGSQTIQRAFDSFAFLRSSPKPGKQGENANPSESLLNQAQQPELSETAKYLKSEVEAGRYSSISELSKTGDATLIPYLRSLVANAAKPNQSDQAPFLAHVALARIGDKAALTEIYAELSDENPGIQDAAMEKLSKVGGPGFSRLFALISDIAPRRALGCRDNDRGSSSVQGSWGCDVVFLPKGELQ